MNRAFPIAALAVWILAFGVTDALASSVSIVQKPGVDLVVVAADPGENNNLWVQGGLGHLSVTDCPVLNRVVVLARPTV